MVPILAKQALARKCEFSNAKMTGNYECAYALGVVSGALAIPKAENVTNLVELKNKIEPQYKALSSDNEKIKKLVLLLRDYEPSDIFDEQMMELYGTASFAFRFLGPYRKYGFVSTLNCSSSGY